MVQPITNLVHFGSLCAVCLIKNAYFFKSSKVVRSGKDQNSGYPEQCESMSIMGVTSILSHLIEDAPLTLLCAQLVDL